MGRLALLRQSSGRLDGRAVAADNPGMRRAAVFFDRDNTLIASDGYLGDPAKVVLIEGAAELIAAVRAKGYAVVVVSNQSGVARGMFGEEDTQAVNARVDALLRAANADAVIDAHYYCPHHPQAPMEKYRVDCQCRKPRPGMLLDAARDLGLDLGRSWLVGDAPRDIEAGKAVGCRTILFVDPGLAASPAAGEKSKATPDAVVRSLVEAGRLIAPAMP